MTNDLELTGCNAGFEADILEKGFDPSTVRKIARHPCFSKEASHKYGRIHLPVAPECNMQCNYCLREFDCVNESRPGVTSQVLTPVLALGRTKEVIAKFDNICTIAIAGPGEPLANEETFETFRLVGENFKGLRLCVSSNGLLLADKVNILSELGVTTITVTMSAVNPRIGEQLYSWIIYEGESYRGIEAAQLLIEKQLEGIQLAVENGILVKINSVMIPTVNDHHIVEIARKGQVLGAFMHNIMPLIPQYRFAHLRPPTADQRKKAQHESARYIPQMRHCRQCRADAIGLLEKDLSKEFFKPGGSKKKRPSSLPLRVAVPATS